MDARAADCRLRPEPRPLIELRYRPAVAICLVALVGPGCGVEPAGEPPIRTLPDGRLSVDPPPLTLEDVATARIDSPNATLLRLWFAVQWGAEPMIVETYAPAIAEQIGARLLIDAWNARRSAVIGSRPRIVHVTRGKDRTVVRYVVESRLEPPAWQSATMVHAQRQWRILHDSLLEDALVAHAVAVATRSGVPSFEASRRGEQVRRRLRDMAATSVEGGSVRPPARRGAVMRDAPALPPSREHARRGASD